MTTRRLTLLALAGTLLPVLVLIGLTLRATGGVWEYALDDVYIHLAMSEGIARGEYGVNPGEPASASSSILYPWLLVPLAGTAFHPWWPLALGLIGALVFALLWARVLGIAAAEAPEGLDWLAPAMALLGPVFLHVPAMAVIGMEHMLHVAVTLAALAGLLEFARTGRIGWLLVAGLVLNPLLRFEGLAVLVLGCAVLAWAGRARAALAFLLAAAVPLAAHALYMASLGLDILPNSVKAKAAIVGGGDRAVGAAAPSRMDQMILSWRLAMHSPSGKTLIVASLVFAFGLLAARRRLPREWAAIGWMAVLLMLAHVSLGSTIWYYRYEVYAWAFAVGAGAALLARARPAPRAFAAALGAAFALGVAAGGAHYLKTGFVTTPQGSAAIAAQQRQMGRFVDEFWRAPVAVNDLGHVAYANPHYVLDLWGLANGEALELRLRGHDPLWADKLAARHGARAALIYDHWLSDAVGPDWVKVAELRLSIPTGTLGGPVVSIYATDAEAVAPLRAALEAFAPTLPETVALEFMEGPDA